MLTHILLGLCCFISFVNFIAIVFLSNSIFRILAPAKRADSQVSAMAQPQATSKGLMDIKDSPTYDLRFRNG